MKPKERMLRAYKGEPVDTVPVAPEFWYYYPAKILGVDMIEFERNIPLWRGLKTTFEYFACEGWGAAFTTPQNEDKHIRRTLKNIGDKKYEETTEISWQGRIKQTMGTKKIYHASEPSWVTEHPVKSPEEIPAYVDMELDPNNRYDFSEVIQAHAETGEAYLLEFWLGVPFFDFFGQAMGFEKAVYYFLSEEDKTLWEYHHRYTDYTCELVRRVCGETGFESFVIGCSSSCNSLLGPDLWRKWDKPYITAVAEEVHRHGRMLHIHFHGKSGETLGDFVETGVDCVCPFERPPGGDIEGAAGLTEVRRHLRDRVTMNGNVHTVKTLIQGSQKDVQREVREIKEAFRGSKRFIIGTGDQVGRETREENLWAMIREGRSRG